jgi:hypothetical protein
VQSCLREHMAVRLAAPACLDCYSAELICTLSECLSPCLNEVEESCRSCRRAHCGAAFATCSGLRTAE